MELNLAYTIKSPSGRAEFCFQNRKTKFLPGSSANKMSRWVSIKATA